MLELNKVLLVGNLTRDPDVRQVASGKSVAKVDIAVNRKGYGDRQDEVAYIEVIAWEKLAEFASKYLTKGTAIFVEGRLKMETWQDKDTGAKRSKLNVVADRIQFAGSKRDNEGQGAAPAQSAAAASKDEAGLPF